MNSKDNPDSFSILANILNLPKPIKMPKNCFRRNRALYNEIRVKNKLIEEQREAILKPYKAGKYKEWEGDGYYMSNVYLYEGKYYG